MPRLLRRISVAAALLLSSCASPVVHQPSRPQVHVEAQLPASLDDVIGALRELFNDGMAHPAPPNKYPPGDRLHHFLLFPREVPEGRIGLPDDAALRHAAGDNPALARYVSLPYDSRGNDFFLYRPLDYYWRSEYERKGRPVDFTCHFILHVRRAGAQRTHLEVIEYLPMVRAGRRLDWTRHGVGVGWVTELKRVPPTTRDRVELLTRIAAAVDARK